MMLADRVHPVRAWLMWAAVRLFGPRFPGKPRIAEEGD